MEMSSAGSANRDEDYDRKLKDAQDELDRIQLQRDELERKKSELEELTIRKRTFISQQIELTEKFTSSLTFIDRGARTVPSLLRLPSRQNSKAKPR